jgi:surface antigen
MSVTTLKTGDHGGQCVAYAKAMINPKSGIRGNANTWYTNAAYSVKTQLKGKVVACWSGGKQGYGHVGVVQEYDPATKKMLYSDSNYKNDEKVIVRPDITEADMKRLFGSSYTFQGYIELK